MLSELLLGLLPNTGRILDVGAGSGEIAAAMMTACPDISIEGIDVLVRPETMIPVRQFDGNFIDCADNTYDYSMLVDVLHHCGEPAALLLEAARVARHGVLIKDHVCKNHIDKMILSFMDIVGNKPYGVEVIYNYFSWSEWQEAFDSCNLRVDKIIRRTNIYPCPFSYLFDRDLHMIALLVKVD